ncbi:MAG: ankyrin repeat domain-containing protein [Alphaproteobacteria bacterium]
MDWKKPLKTVRKFLTTKAQLSLNLAQAAKDNNLARATELIADGAKPDNKAYRSDNALNHAIDNGNLEMVKLLLAAGADPNVNAGYSAVTPFLNAADKGNTDIVAALVEAKADVNAQDGRGSTALIYASNAKNRPLVNYLLEKGANVDLRNNSGWSPLFYAARGGDTDIIGKLLAKGARTDWVDNEDRSVIDVATRWQQPAALARLHEHIDALMPEWQTVKDGQLAHVSFFRTQGYRLTEIFNFETKQCKIISYNFQTGRDAVITKTFTELGDDAVNVATSKRAVETPKPAPKPVAQP